MPEGWEWDQTLYRGAARFYRRGRLPYALELGAALARELRLDGSGRLIDIGCGPGIVALAMTGFFEEVVGIDADAEMIAEASAETERTRVTNARWVCLRAEDLPGGLGTFGVATFAQSFHWMQRERVAAVVRSMLDGEKGALVHINAHTRRGVEPHGSTPYPRAPHEGIDELVAGYLGPARRAGRGILAAGTPDDEDTVLRDAGFEGPAIVTLPDRRVFTRTIDDVVASVYSVSGSAPHLFGDRRTSFESDLRGILASASPSGLFSAQATDNELRIWRPR